MVNLTERERELLNFALELLEENMFKYAAEYDGQDQKALDSLKAAFGES
jgi:hypothetical protein